jgi:hypothetical protein
MSLRQEISTSLVVELGADDFTGSASRSWKQLLAAILLFDAVVGWWQGARWE